MNTQHDNSSILSLWVIGDKWYPVLLFSFVFCCFFWRNWIKICNMNEWNIASLPTTIPQYIGVALVVQVNKENCSTNMCMHAQYISPSLALSFPILQRYQGRERGIDTMLYGPTHHDDTFISFSITVIAYLLTIDLGYSFEKNWNKKLFQRHCFSNCALSRNFTFCRAQLQKLCPAIKF